MEIINETLMTHLYKLTKTQKCFSISPEYNEDNGEHIRAFHIITLNSIEEKRIQINNSKPKNHGYYNRQWTKTKRALEIKVVLGRMTDLKKKNCLVHCVTTNWMIII